MDQGQAAVEPYQRIILALDGMVPDRAVEVAGQLKGKVGLMKVGLELFLAEGGGHSVVNRVQKAGDCEIMLDLKLHDIKNTLRGAVRSVRSLAPQFLTVHASSGIGHLAVCVDQAGPGIGILGVTVLTSIDAQSFREAGHQSTIASVVHDRAMCALRAGCAGIVCSPEELVTLAGIDRRRLKRVVPGVRPPWAPSQDQQRVMEPGEAITAGADYLVIGRPILEHPGCRDSFEAIERICEEIREAKPPPLPPEEDDGA